MAVNKVVFNQDGEEKVLVDLTDSTVTPDDMPEGVVAYDKSGEKIFGRMPYLYFTESFETDGSWTFRNGIKYFWLNGKSAEKGILDVGNEMGLFYPLESFGTARPEDVVAGKTFTSGFGIEVEGTLEAGSGSIEVMDDGNGNLKILNAVVTDSNGDITVTM